MAAALAIASLVSVVVVAVLMIYGTVTRERRWGEGGTWWAEGSEGDDPGSGVREPRRPLPSGSSATALADPTDEAA